MEWLKRSWRTWIAFSFDLTMVPFAWLIAYWVRYNLAAVPETMIDQAVSLLPLLIVVQMASFWQQGLYRGVWRFASMPDLARIIKAVFLGTSVFLLSLFFMNRVSLVPRSVFLIYGMLMVMLLGGTRFLYRWVKDYFLSYGSSERVLIVGAGDVSEGLVRALIRDSKRLYQPVGIVEKRSKQKGRDIHGIRVLGVLDDIPQLAKDQNIDLIIIALPEAGSALMRHVVELCEKTGRPFKTIPTLEELVSGRATINALRSVSVEDLLGREPVALNWNSIQVGLKSKRILVSGGGGSIGSELCRQIAKIELESLIVIENNEFNLYRLGMEFGRHFPDVKIKFFLVDTCDEVAINHVMSTFRPQIVFHASAYKHVPILQDQIRSAVKTNILGTKNMVKASVIASVERFVLISTDKAVNPTNIMGATKQVAELVCRDLYKNSRTQFLTVRFGNVLDSAGSVVPLFKRQIEEGGPVTVTHPDITRFFMTIPEAVQLIMQATVMGQGNEIFVLDMGEPILIRYLAEQMIKLSGRERDVSITYTGLRPGEKLYEELFHDHETLTATGHPKIMTAKPNHFDTEQLEKVLTEMSKACDRYDINQLRELLNEIVVITDTPKAENILPFSTLQSSATV